MMRSGFKETSEKARDRINQVIFDHKLKETEIARALSITPQALHYQLHLSSNLDREIEKGIFIYFRSIGIIQDTADECKMITENFLEFTSIINQQISILSNNVKKVIADGNVTSEERARLLSLAKNLRKESNQVYDDLELSIKGIVTGE